MQLCYGTCARQAPASAASAPSSLRANIKGRLPFQALSIALFVFGSAMWAQSGPASRPPAKIETPPRILQAQRFLARRGATGRRTAGAWKARAAATPPSPQSSSANLDWEPLGPLQVISANYGLVTGRITSLALDPSDPTGNRLFVGTTGGGLWLAQNAATADVSSVAFSPLTDRPAALEDAQDSSISIGAVTVQPGGTGVILAGTGDPNDALDSYYGAGILRSADGGNTWTLIRHSSDVELGLAETDYGFAGEGFAGFAWSTINPQAVVAAVSHAYEGELVDAGLAGYSYAGLYYSSDSGATWHLAKITDGNGQDVQGPFDAWAGADGNAATSVVWNPARNRFVAAVRFHGYYQSPDGVTWTRMAAQPGSGLTTAACPTNTSMTGSTGCPIFRGALAVNPVTGDAFAWTVDLNNQDQGLWQDVCNLTSGSCANRSLAFTKQWSTVALQTGTGQQAATIANGEYNLALAAVPSGQDTLLLAGANDLWKCSLSAGCTWRNTTNSTTCRSAHVGGYQHAIAWSTANPLSIFVGNDLGLWRSEDAIGETDLPCSSSDASHWQNLNGGLGSLAEVENLAVSRLSPYTLMAGLGAIGTAGLKGGSGPAGQWPEILGGDSGPVAIDPTHPDNWYANNAAGVSIHLCAQAGNCSPTDFGVQPAVTDADTGGDGQFMTTPAPFLVDPVDPSQLLIATCRLWRGPANGSGWTAANAITPILGGGADCGSSPQIRSLAAAALPGGGEIVYVGLYGGLNGGGNMGGHVLTVSMNAAGTWSGWNDVSQSPVSNDPLGFNPFSVDVSSLTIDPHDTTAQTLYATLAGIPNPDLKIQMAYRSTDGGNLWTSLTSNLVFAPANALVVDPVDANTVYLGTDVGVFATRQVASCGDFGDSCWAAYGSGLPEAPVTSLAATQPSASLNVLLAGTYGRGVWQIPLFTAGQQMTSATAAPAALTFPDQPENTTSAALTVAVSNTGGIALSLTAPTASGDFAWADPNHCIGALIDTNRSCSIAVTFTPSALGSRTGQLILQGNIAAGNIVVNLSGTGTAPPQVTLSPQSIDFGSVETGGSSAALQVTAVNRSGAAVAISNVGATSPFTVSENACGSAIAAKAQCSLSLQFSPTSTGSASGKLTMVDDGGTQTVQLSGMGTAPPTDTLGSASLTFPPTVIGVPSPAQKVTLTNSGGNPLTSIAISVSGPFQQSNDCTTQLIGGQSCAISTVFLPTAPGQQSGELIVSDILHTQTVALQGTGLNPPEFTVTPASLTFSAARPGVTSPPQTLTVTNSGGASMANIGFQIIGAAAGAYAVSPNPCAAKLDTAASCTARVTFTPPPSGPISADLVVTSSSRGPNNSAITATVPLNGGNAGTLVAQPALVTFPLTGVGQTSATSVVTLTDQSGSKAFDNLSLTASDSFRIGANGCAATLAAGTHCTLQIAFVPTAAGPQTGALTIASSALASPLHVPLSGNGFDFSPTVTGASVQTVSSGETATFTLAISAAASVGASFTFQCSSLPQYASCNFNPGTLSVPANATGNETVQIATGQSTALARPEWRSGGLPVSLACGALLLWPVMRRRRRGWILLILLAVLAVVGGQGCSGSGGGTGGAAPADPSNHNTPPGTYTISVGVQSNGVQHSVALTLVVD